MYNLFSVIHFKKHILIGNYLKNKSNKYGILWYMDYVPNKLIKYTVCLQILNILYLTVEFILKYN